MGLYFKKKYPYAAVGIWEIKESFEDYYSKVNLSEREKNIFSYLRTEERKQQWLSYRMILPYLIKPKELSTIEYDQYGKPFLNNGVKHISVSHSGKFSALIASNKYSVGIDIEQIKPKIINIADKFITENEKNNLSKQHEIESLSLIWSCKEAIYKVHGKRNIAFKKHIKISPFTFEGEGTVYGTLEFQDFKKQFCIQYQLIENYILAFTIDTESKSKQTKAITFLK